jgi:redox-sensitive bicupin YhaK (pirin superfamily)
MEQALQPQMILRRSQERGHLDHGWLDTYHTFSFASYYDPAWMGFRGLRVINEDRVAPGRGFGQHPHREMEIITYVIAGRVAHQDTTGGQGVIGPGEVQVMSAGTGLEHSEFNPSRDEPLHLMQIWIQPNRRGVAPRYDQRPFPLAERTNKLAPIAGPIDSASANGALGLYMDSWLYGLVLEPKRTAQHVVADGRGAWVHLVKGGVEVNGTPLSTGDAAGFERPVELTITATEPSELLVFDLA